jgi:acyl dehydratase
MSTRRRSECGFPFELGDEAGAFAHVGSTSRPLHGDVRVNAAQLQTQAAVLEDANPAYWDEDFARAHWGSLISPPGMLQLWTLPLAWTPTTGPRCFHGAATEATLPGDLPLNVSTDTEYFEPIREGDRLTQTDTLLDVKRADRTPFGPGHLVIFRSDYHNQHGRLVARLTNTLLRYRSEPPAAAVDAPRAEAPLAESFA